MTQGQEAAFPGVEYKQPSPDGAHIMTIVGGLTKREYFAGLAMQGFISAAPGRPYEHKDDIDTATMAVKYADALLAELARGQT